MNINENKYCVKYLLDYENGILHSVIMYGLNKEHIKERLINKNHMIIIDIILCDNH